MTGTAETLAIAALLIVLSWMRRHASAWLRRGERALGRMGRRQGLFVALIGLLALVGSAALSLLGRMPYPRVHDEFSYLLAADTFAHGRLSNPTHPMWVHFESLHIIHQPTYASKYPPGQGLMLAAGQIIAGHPVVGMWIGTGLAVAALSWMLFGWFPPKWAVVGSLLAVLHPGILVYWSQSYMSGTVAMLGGALVFGAMRRIVRKPSTMDAVILGVGLAVLANSRPYEGLVASLPVAVVLVAWVLGKTGKQRPSLRVAISRIALPTAGVLMFAGIGMAYYNLRVTGNALRLPYMVHEEAYATAPFFLWQQPRPIPTYRHEIIRTHHVAALNQYAQQHSFRGFVRAGKEKIRSLRVFYLAPPDIRVALIIPLLMLPWIWRDRWPRWALVTCAIVLAGLAVETWVMPHYAAPVTALVCVILLQGMRHFFIWRRHSIPGGRFVVWAIGAVAVISFVSTFVQQVRIERPRWGAARANLIAQLKQDGVRHLVIVRYGPQYSTEYKWAYWEWVYNEADIDRAQVVWAREMHEDQNRRLLEYFKDRKVWLLALERQDSPPKLEPYPWEPVLTVAPSDSL
jgi:hypothetical protein